MGLVWNIYEEHPQLNAKTVSVIENGGTHI